MRYTKIVCTIGPASRSIETITQLIKSGMDVARINFSHGDLNEHAEVIGNLRTISAELERPLAILGDLQGPKLRVGRLPDSGYALQAGDKVQIHTGTESDGIPCLYDDLPRLVSKGDRILLDDGLLELEVMDASVEMIDATVMVGGVLHANKGINLPQADMRIPAITEKDREDLAFAVEQGLDWIALSFVRTAEELLELRMLIRQLATSEPLPQIIAKIEKPEAVTRIKEIIETSDGIMVARGDLGIELPAEDVPMVQKEIIRLCNQAGRPVITATQMLDSMIRNPRPTRAEASDVANAVLDGTDAVMLSGETAVGKYPVPSVQVMDRIVTRAEATLPRGRTQPKIVARINFAAQAIARAAGDLAQELGAAAIIAPTSSGYTARQIARYRPGLPIIAITPKAMVQRQLNLYWGVVPLVSPRRNTTDEVVEDAVRAAMQRGLVQQGDLVVITAGTAGSTPGTTNLIKVRLIEHVLTRGEGRGTQKVRGLIRKLRPPLPPDLVIGVNDIVVAHAFDSSWQRLIRPAVGIIAEEGSPNSVAVRLAEEMKVPAIVNAESAFSQLKEGDSVILDPIRGLVYRGLSLDDVRGDEAELADLETP